MNGAQRGVAKKEFYKNLLVGRNLCNFDFTDFDV